MDAKDILGIIPKATPPEKKPRSQKDSHRKPDGVSREASLFPCSQISGSYIPRFLISVASLKVYALTGGLGPLVPVVDTSHLKRRPPSDNEKAKLHTLPKLNFFTESALGCW
ncbi:hypothetical protein ACLOJK_017493 [Asimina triloba]